MGLYGIGQPVPREEDPKLLRGHGRYVDDIHEPGEARGYVLRSPHAHANIKSIDVSAARSAPGVLAVLTPDDYKARGLGAQRPMVPRKKSDGSDAFTTPLPLLEGSRVRYVGQPIAFIVAETINQAKDAAELIEIDFESLPAVVTAEEALAPGAPTVWDENPGNEAYLHQAGDKAATDAAFAKAAHVIKNRTIVNRVTAASMEPRGCIGVYDPEEDNYTLRATIQSVHQIRQIVAGAIFRKPQSHFRVICENMGGGFGMKGGCGLEFSLCLWASEVVGRPVKWISERSEGMLTDEQARDSVIDTELALDENGKFLGLRTQHICSMGAYNTSERNIMPSIVALACLANTYTFPAVHVQVKGVFINTMQIAFYRGGGRPEPLYVTETIVDKAARELGIDPTELRRRNTITADAMPYVTAMKQTYDCGDFIKNLDDCMDRVGWKSLDQRKAEARKRGKLLGAGVATTVAAAAGRDWEHAEVRFDPSGTVTLISGSMDHGQGHGTTYKQILSQKLGIDADLIKYKWGDTDVVASGIGTFGSRSTALGGSAVAMAGDKIIEKGKRIAAHALEAAYDDITFGEGRFTVVGTDKTIELTEVAKKSYQHAFLPNDIEPGFYERADYGSDNSATFPNGAHICEVEIDIDTGKVDLTRYFAVDDVGVMINPLLCAGQIYGGIAQGAGQALMEDLRYDHESGQLLAGSFLDYCMPRADDFCDFDLHENVVPTERNPLGVKGAGEAGTCGALPAVMNAVNDALAQIDAPQIEMPATSEKVWNAIRGARAAA